MDLAILTTFPSPQVANRGNNERRLNRAHPQENSDAYVFKDGIFIDQPHRDVISNSKTSTHSTNIGKLEPFLSTDLSNGIYADPSDPLGRVWYHIPNLGPKFCDAVRKYSIIANFREAHVIARKRSKESECMWVGIVGDPASYTTGSKRHLIDLMLRNPGVSIPQSGRRQQVRTRQTKPHGQLKKRRRKRRRTALSNSQSSEVSPSEGLIGSQRRKGLNLGVQSARSVTDDRISGSPSGEDESSRLSTTPSVMSVDRQRSGQYGFHVRDISNVSPPPLRAHANLKPNLFSLPNPTSYSGPVLEDWIDSVNRDPALFALREIPLPSPEAGKILYVRPNPPSPTLQTAVRKYSVEDLNELLKQCDEYI
jgi:hypothetical protein